MARDPEDLLREIDESLDIIESELRAVAQFIRLLRSRVKKLAKEVKDNEQET